MPRVLGLIGPRAGRGGVAHNRHDVRTILVVRRFREQISQDVLIHDMGKRLEPNPPIVLVQKPEVILIAEKRRRGARVDLS
jgi:hypothetical protein